MAINIKNEETCRLIEELARLTGDTLTGAVTAAVKEQLERQRKKDRVDRLRAIAHDCASRLKEPFKSMDHADLLYDEMGLPK